MAGPYKMKTGHNSGKTLSKYRKPGKSTASSRQKTHAGGTSASYKRTMKPSTQNRARYTR